MVDKKGQWKCECAKALEKYKEARDKALREHLLTLDQRQSSIWDFYQDQKGGTCNG